MIVNEFGRLYKFNSNFSPFPHEERLNGHRYNEEHYSFSDHYNDSTVAVFIPDYLSGSDSINMVFYFHGWWNNIDTSISQFDLIKQFHTSKINGVLVLPESSKDAADSFGGRLEEKNTFKNLFEEITNKLRNELGPELYFDKITLAGHSGAYRIISYILLRGGLTERINNVYLFDGLYGQLEKFTYWIDNYKGRFINIYTPNGGTKGESENLIECLESWQIPFKILKKDDFSADELRNERIIIIESLLSHNEVISSKNQFQKFLESSR